MAAESGSSRGCARQEAGHHPAARSRGHSREGRMATSKSAFLKQAKKDLPRVNTSDLVELAAAIEKELKIRARLGMRGLVVKDKATKAAEEKARINRELKDRKST